MRAEALEAVARSRTLAKWMLLAPQVMQLPAGRMGNSLSDALCATGGWHLVRACERVRGACRLLARPLSLPLVLTETPLLVAAGCTPCKTRADAPAVWCRYKDCSTGGAPAQRFMRARAWLVQAGGVARKSMLRGKSAGVGSRLRSPEPCATHKRGRMLWLTYCACLSHWGRSRQALWRSGAEDPRHSARWPGRTVRARRCLAGQASRPVVRRRAPSPC